MQNVKKIDVHVHTMYFPDVSLPRPDGSNYATPAQLIAMYDAWGIEKGVLLPEITNECAYTQSTSEEVCMISRAHPDRFLWFCNLSPRMGNNDAHTDFGFYLDHYKRLGAKGVGEVCANLPFDDPAYDNMLAACAEADMPVTIHISPTIGGNYGVYDDEGLPRLERMLKKHPRLRVFGHSQCFWEEISARAPGQPRGAYPTGRVIPGRLEELMRECPNLFCDLSAGSGGNALMRDEDYAFRFIEAFGDRLLYGTDICAPTNYFPLGKWLDEKHAAGCISDKNYYAICRGNAIRELKPEEDA